MTHMYMFMDKWATSSDRASTYTHESQPNMPNDPAHVSRRRDWVECTHRLSSKFFNGGPSSTTKACSTSASYWPSAAAAVAAGVAGCSTAGSDADVANCYGSCCWDAAAANCSVRFVRVCVEMNGGGRRRRPERAKTTSPRAQLSRSNSNIQRTHVLVRLVELLRLDGGRHRLVGALGARDDGRLVEARGGVDRRLGGLGRLELARLCGWLVNVGMGWLVWCG